MPVLALFYSLFALAIPIGIVGVLVYLGWRFVRAQEVRARVGSGDEGLTRRITELEEAVGRIDADLLRLDEGQRFMTRLLTERREATPASGNEIQ